MLYLGIDQHGKQLTISLLGEAGDALERRQVSTRPERVREFFQELQRRAVDAGGWMAILEVCGFNDWLIELLQETHCREIVLIHPGRRSKRKTDRRDAHALAELLWVNRQRLLGGHSPKGLRRVLIPDAQTRQDRQVTALRMRAGQQRTRVVNAVKHLLLKRNLLWNYPTKTFDTIAGWNWLIERPLDPLDRLELDHLLQRWELLDGQIDALERWIERRALAHPACALLRTCPGVSAYSSLALVSRIGPIDRFPQARSLGNYFGLTPSSRNSGETTDRLGSITKEGSKLARFILAQLVLHLRKKDGRRRQWFQGIKRRRGAKVARVAVMRQLTTIFWHMLKHQQKYQPGPRPASNRSRPLATAVE